MLNGVGFVNEPEFQKAAPSISCKEGQKVTLRTVNIILYQDYTEIRMQLITNRQTGEKRPWRIRGVLIQVL